MTLHSLLSPGSTLLSALPGVPNALVGAVIFQSILATVLFSLVGYAYYRRRTRPYLFVWIAVSTLVLEGFIGIVGIFTSLDPVAHVAVDHGLDIILLSMVFAAVHYARRIDRQDRRSRPNHE